MILNTSIITTCSNCDKLKASVFIEEQRIIALKSET